MTQKQLRRARWLALLAYLIAREAVRHAAQVAKYRHARHLRRIKMYGPTYGQPATPPTYDEEVLADAPLSYWKLDELSGTIAADSAGSHPGEYAGDVTLGVPFGLVGIETGIELATIPTGTPPGDGPRVDVPTPAFDIRGHQPFTLEGWVDVISRASSATFFLFNTGTAVDNSTVDLAIYTSDAKLGVELSRASQNDYYDADEVVEATGVSHIVGRYDGTTLSVFVNGQQLPASGPGVYSVSINRSIPDVGPLTIGYEGGEGLYRLARFAVYAHALSPERIAAHYAAGIAA